jgi:hypothetical protein
MGARRTVSVDTGRIAAPRQSVRGQRLQTFFPRDPDGMLARALDRAKATRERDVLIVGCGIEHREDRRFDRIDEDISVLDADKGVAAVMW